MWSMMKWKSFLQASDVSSVQLDLRRSWRVNIKASCMDCEKNAFVYFIAENLSKLQKQSIMSNTN